MNFKIEAKAENSSARAGVIQTEHGEIRTPIFMPVGTLGSVKAVPFTLLESEINADIILGNTYHLYLRPGIEILEKHGGLHKFTTWNRPMLTDSGGYQVYSLSDRRKITEEGVQFASHIDGSKHFFTPERVMDIQRSIGADFIMAFDECTPFPCERKYAEDSMQMTHRWLKRCKTRFEDTRPLYGYEQSLVPIVQGSTYADLRRQSAEVISEFDFPMNAIGGLSVGEPDDEMYGMTEVVNAILPEDKPRYLMGVGTPLNLLESIHRGVDMFDCVMPTRNARNGQLFTMEGIINIKNAKWKDDLSPIDVHGHCASSRRYSKSYLRHLFISNELFGLQLASNHNLSFYLWLMRKARIKILSGEFEKWKDNAVKKLGIKI